MKRTTTVGMFNRAEVGHDYPPTVNLPTASARGAHLRSTLPSDGRDRRNWLRALSNFPGYHTYRSSPMSLIKHASLASFSSFASSAPAKIRWELNRMPWPAPRSLYDSPIIWLVIYFLFNLTLTLYNKSVLIEFPFPYTLTALHAFCSAAGSGLLLRSDAVTFFGGNRTLPPLNKQEIIVLVSFSMLFTINIAVSNVSLDLVTIPFHQVVRATTPVFAIILSKLLLGTQSSRAKVVSLIPVIAGVSVATYGDYYFTRLGLILTLLGTILSALKTIVTHVLQTSNKRQPSKYIYTPFTAFFHYLQPRPTLSKLSPLQFLHLLSPLACIQSLLMAYMTGELETMYYFAIHHLHHRQQIILIIDGLLALGLNVASFGANKRVGAVTMTVAANVKQVLTMLLAVVVFDLRITSTNALGIALTLAGGACYTAVELLEKERAKPNHAPLPPTTAVNNSRVERTNKSEQAIA